MIDYVPFGVTKFFKINRLKKLVSYRKKYRYCRYLHKFTWYRIDLKFCGIAHPY